MKCMINMINMMGAYLFLPLEYFQSQNKFQKMNKMITICSIKMHELFLDKLK